SVTRYGRAAAALTLALALGACHGGGSGGEGAEVGAQIAHPAGVVLQVESVQAVGDRTLDRARVLNGRNRDVSLNSGRENTYLLTDSGEKLLLAAPAGNVALAVPAGQSIDAALVFAGPLPRGERATLVVNGHGRADNVHTSSPRFA